MTAEEDCIIKEIKECINYNDIEGIHKVYTEEQTKDYLNWGYIYQKIYLHACLKQNHEVVEYLKPMFELLSPIDKMTIRPMFHYGDYLLRKNKET